MMWNAWKELGWMEKMTFVAAAAAIPATAPAPETEEKPNWKSDDSEGGHVRDSANGAELSTLKESLGHQRPS